MVPLAFFKEEIVFGYSNKIVFINIENRKINIELQIQPSAIEKPAKDDEETKSEADERQQQQQKQHDKSTAPLIPYSVQGVKISPNSEFLAVTTTGQKYLLLYQLTPSGNSIELLSTRSISRASNTMTFSNDSKQLLVCDKSGDCYLFDCIDVNAPGKWILGHLSIVLDVIFTPDQKYIITCDRDEKIRVTNYPQSHEIECYCLGHEEFVSSINLLSDTSTLLSSVSGDKTMKIWNYKNGQKLYEIDLKAPGVQHCIRQILNTKYSVENFEEENNFIIYHAAVNLHQTKENIQIYEIKQLKNDKFEHKLLQTFDFVVDSKQLLVTNLYFHKEKLYLIVIDKNHSTIGLEILEFDQINNLYLKIDADDQLKLCVKNYFAEYQIKSNEILDVSLWFKKKFDNVSEYLERKKRRIKEKEEKSAN